MSSACVWCRESLPLLRQPPACPSCGKELVDGAGARLRPIDLDFERFLADADASSLKWTKRGVVFAFVLGALSMVPVVNVGAVFLLIVGQFFFGRFLVARPYTRHFSPTRRFVTRWLTRLALLVLVSPTYGALLAIPFVGVLAAPAVFGGTCWALRAYFRMQFLREHRREGVGFAEKVLLVVFAILFVLLLVFFALVLWLGLSLLPTGTGG